MRSGTSGADGGSTPIVGRVTAGAVHRVADGAPFALASAPAATAARPLFAARRSPPASVFRCARHAGRELGRSRRLRSRPANAPRLAARRPKRAPAATTCKTNATRRRHLERGWSPATTGCLPGARRWRPEAKRGRSWRPWRQRGGLDIRGSVLDDRLTPVRSTGHTMSPSPRSSTPIAAQAGRTMIRDLGAGAGLPGRVRRPDRVRLRGVAGSEVGQHEELPSEDRRWLEKARAALPERVRPAVDDETCIMGAGADHRPAGRHRCRVVRGPRSGPAPAPSSPRSCSPTTSATTSSRPSSRRRSTAIARRSSRCSTSGRSQARVAARGSSTTPTGMLEEVHAAMAAWLPLYQEIEPRVLSIIERDAKARVPELAHAPPVGGDRARDQRHPLAVRAGRPPGRARPVVPRPPVQLHVQRPRLAAVHLPGRRRVARAPRPARAPARASCGSTGHSATTPGSGSCASCATATGTSPRSQSAWSSASRRSSTTSRSCAPPAS